MTQIVEVIHFPYFQYNKTFLSTDFTDLSSFKK